MARECVISDLLGFQGILNPQNFGGLRRKGSFSTPTGDYTSVRLLFAFLADFECKGDFRTIVRKDSLTKKSQVSR